MITQIINLYGAEILGTILVTLFGIFGLALRALAETYLNTDTKRTLARLVVQFTEQTCRQLHGQDKLNAALTALSGLLAEKGIRASEKEMKVLLEAAVAEFNDVFHREKQD